MKAEAFTEGYFELSMIKRKRGREKVFFLPSGIEEKELSLIECQPSNRFYALIWFLTWRTLIAEDRRKLHTHLLSLRNAEPFALIQICKHHSYVFGLVNTSVILIPPIFRVNASKRKTSWNHISHCSKPTPSPKISLLLFFWCVDFSLFTSFTLQSSNVSWHLHNYH